MLLFQSLFWTLGQLKAAKICTTTLREERKLAHAEDVFLDASLQAMHVCQSEAAKSFIQDSRLVGVVLHAMEEPEASECKERMQPEVRNIVVLGLCQNGKTTFINECRQLQNSASAEGAVGNGSERCTEFAQVFDLHPPGEPSRLLEVDDWGKALQKKHPEFKESNPCAVLHQSINMVSSFFNDTADVLENQNESSGYSHGTFSQYIDGKNVENRNSWQRDMWQKLSKLTKEEYFSNVQPKGPVCTSNKRSEKDGDTLGSGASDDGKTPLSIKILDTPGLEDTNGEDDKHVLNVIEFVLEMGSLSGLVLVCKCGLPITPSWRHHVRRYWKLFPMMQDKWIIVHTHSDPFARSAKHRRKTSSYEEAIEQRKQFVAEALKEATEDVDAKAAHIFVECDWDGSEVLEAEFVKSLNTLCLLVAENQSLPIERLHFEKGRDIREIDNMLISAFEGEVATMARTLESVDNQLVELVKLKDRHSQESEEVRCARTRVHRELLELDHPGPVTVSVYLSKPWGFFWSPEDTGTLESKHSTYELTVTDATGYNGQYWERKPDQIQHLEDGRDKITVSLRVPHWFTRLEAKVEATSPSHLVNAEKIAKLKNEKMELDSQLEEIEQKQSEEETLIAGNNEHKDKIKAHVQEAQRKRQFLEGDWSIGTYKKYIDFYKEARGPNKDPVKIQKIQEHFQKIWEETEPHPSTEMH
eukprot:s1312_g11.t3